MNRNLRTILAIVASGVFAAGGNVLYQRYDRDLTELARASTDWPSVPGLVNHSELEFQRKNTGAGKKTDYRVEIVYEYVVDDQLYRNNVVRFDQGELTSKRKELLVSSYPVGRRVEVFYNPDDPDQSVLVRGSYEQ
ncbi:MAG: DUF3592 domain-containing protein [Woeseiaceae bacterium]|nr:DUF3592 domain-containing protein [Woeseiaceae bacterium]